MALIKALTHITNSPLIFTAKKEPTQAQTYKRNIYKSVRKSSTSQQYLIINHLEMLINSHMINIYRERELRMFVFLMRQLKA